jgi:hypothetical protein
MPDTRSAVSPAPSVLNKRRAGTEGGGFSAGFSPKRLAELGESNVPQAAGRHQEAGCGAQAGFIGLAILLTRQVRADRGRFPAFGQSPRKVPDLVKT